MPVEIIFEHNISGLRFDFRARNIFSLDIIVPLFGQADPSQIQQIMAGCQRCRRARHRTHRFRDRQKSDLQGTYAFSLIWIEEKRNNTKYGWPPQTCFVEE